MARRPFVYILGCGDGSLYTGVAKDLTRRISEHQAGTASKYTRSHLPVKLVWSRQVSTWRRALQLERQIKRLSRARKLALIAASSKRRAGPNSSPAAPSSMG